MGVWPGCGRTTGPGPLGPAAVQPTIVSGDLTYAGLASAGGGRSAQFGGNGDSALMDLSFSSGGLTPGSYPTVYFSYTLKLTDLSVLDTNGVALTGFNQLQAHDHNYSVVPAVGGVVMLRGDGAGGFNLGIDGGGKGGTPATIAWDTTSYSAGQTLFLVGNYDFTSGDYATGDGHLWINPNASTFGAGSAPGGDLLSGGNSQALARIGSIILEDNADTEPTGQIDDLRVGLTWADVTPAAVPEPSAFAFGAMGMLCLWLVRFRRKSV